MTSAHSILLVSDWFDQRFHLGVARAVRERGWSLSMEAVYARELPVGWRGAGCVALVDEPGTAAFVRSLKVPVVNVSARSRLNLPCVRGDNAAVGREAAEHFLAKGYRNLAYHGVTTTGSRAWISDTRRDAFRRCVEAVGATFHDLTPTEHGGRWSTRRRLLGDRLCALPPATGLLCVDDMVAATVVEVALERGIAVPARLAVLGVGDLTIASEGSRIPLSSVPEDFAHIGREAVELLDEILTGRHGEWPLRRPPTREVPPAEIIERESTNGVAVRDARFGALVERMLERPGDALSSAEMTKLTGIGRSRLHEVFKAEFRATPAQFLERIRFQAACRRMAAPGVKLSSVAAETGFGSLQRMNQAFRRQAGVSPGRWRRNHRGAVAGSPEGRAAT